MTSIDKLITALAPVFAAGFAVQQLLEILTSFFDLDSKKFFQNYKKPILGFVAFLFGWGLASQLDKGVLEILQGTAKYSTLDMLATALIISAGTEGVNSILKFLKYSKEDKKREAAGSDPQSGGSAGAGAGAVPPPVPRAAPLAPPVPAAAPAVFALKVPTEAALTRINRQ